MKPKGYAAIIAVIAVLAGMLYFISRSPTPYPGNPEQTPPPPPEKMDAKTIAANWQTIIQNTASAPLGNPKAPFTLIECGDFQCPNCGNASPVLEQMVKDSGGKVKLYFLNFPIVSIHPHALESAEAGLAAAAQGKFWPMYHMLYSHQDELIDSEIEYRAKAIPGLNTTKLAADISSHRFRSAIAQSGQLMNKLAMHTTPTILFRKENGPVTIIVGTNGDTGNPGLYSFAPKAPWLSSAQRQATALYIQQVIAANKEKAESGGESVEQ